MPTVHAARLVPPAAGAAAPIGLYRWLVCWAPSNHVHSRPTCRASSGARRLGTPCSTAAGPRPCCGAVTARRRYVKCSAHGPRA